VRVHTALPDTLSAAADAVLRAGGAEPVHHGTDDAVGAAERAVADDAAVAIIGPYRSQDVAEALEVTAPAGLPLLAPAATWVGVTRDDESGSDDAPQHRGTVFRMLARDTVVAERIAAHARDGGRRALVIAGEHDYGRQLDAQLRRADLPRADDPARADAVILCGLAGEPEIDRAREHASLPILAFDGIQGADLGDREVLVAMPYGPVGELPHEDVLAGAQNARRAAQLVVSAGAPDRAALLAALRALKGFDEHGDPVAPTVWLWRAQRDWTLEPVRPI
jgi:Periplasmic binding protein